MKNRFLLFWMVFSNIAFAQNGRLISAKEVTQPDSIKQSRIQRIPYYQKVFDSTKLTDITYLSEGLKIKGFIAEPKAPGKYPCVIFCRGGNRDFGKIDWLTTTFFNEIASHGYVVIASQYRGTTGSEGSDEFGGADTMDVINCIPALANWPSADTLRIGMYGISRGGMMVYQSLRSLKNIKAAIINSGAANQYDNFLRKDGAAWDSGMYGIMIPHYFKDKEAQLKLRSAMYWPEKIAKTTPFLIMHGSGDWRTPLSSTLTLVQKLTELKHPLRFVLYEGAVHGLRGVGISRENMWWEWLDKYVKNKSALPDMELHGE